MTTKNMAAKNYCDRIFPILKLSFLILLFMPFLLGSAKSQALVRSQDSASKTVCYPFLELGLFCYQPEQTANQPLLIFIRGLYQGSGQVDSIPARMQAAQAAFDNFNLELLNRPVLVMGSSHLAVDSNVVSEVRFFYQKNNLGDFSDYDLAAHSGGYAGLFVSLKEILNEQIPAPKMLIMLDNFYSVIPTNVEMYRQVMLQGKIKCGGFLTDHNMDRYRRLYQHSNCNVLGPDGQNHNGSVFPTLVKFLN